MDFIDSKWVVFYSLYPIHVTAGSSHTRIELEFSDFTLYFLAFDHSGGKATDAEKKADRHKREGAPLTTAPSYIHV